MNDKKQLAIISGGTGYLGSVIAKTLKENGWSVVSLSRNAEDLDAIVCDITNENHVRTVINDIVQKFGNIDAVIHAASPSLERVSLLSVSSNSFRNTIDTAVSGAFYLAKYAVPHMTENSTFIGITSQAVEPRAKYQPYGAYIVAKYALRGLLRTLSIELVQSKIRVYAISPGFLPGGLNRDLPEKVLKFFSDKKGEGISSPEEVASIVKRVCFDIDSYPTGVSISIPSGVSTSI